MNIAPIDNATITALPVKLFCFGFAKPQRIIADPVLGHQWDSISPRQSSFGHRSTSQSGFSEGLLSHDSSLMIHPESFGSVTFKVSLQTTLVVQPVGAWQGISLPSWAANSHVGNERYYNLILDRLTIPFLYLFHLIYILLFLLHWYWI